MWPAREGRLRPGMSGTAVGRHSTALRVLGLTAAGFLLVRAPSGRDGPLARWRNDGPATRT